jgi:hypothetical protein
MTCQQTLKPQLQKLSRSMLPQRRCLAASAGGYGLMLLMVFITSTVLVGASLQMVVGSSTAGYLGTTSQDNTAAQQLAQKGMEIVLADMQSDLNSGITVDSSYTYSSSGTDASMPTDPASLGGGTTSLGSFSATMTSVFASNYLVKVTATVGSVTTSVSKLVKMTRSNSTNVMDSMTNARAIYSLRKMRSAYSGSAIRVRRSSDNTEQDIGFDSAGNLDMDSLRTFISASVSPPLDSVGSAAAAFGLRKLRTAYTTNKLIRVRRSNDNTEIDIGYTSTGDLDVKTLMNFAGWQTAYVKTWYDQSGNGLDATQTTTSKQPSIVQQGVLNTVNNRPAIKFDGTDDRLTFTRSISDDFTMVANYSVVAGYGTTIANGSGGGTVWNTHAGLVDADVTGSSNDFGLSIDTSGHLYTGNGSSDTSISSATTTSTSISSPGYNDSKMHWAVFTRAKSTGFLTLFHDRLLYSGTNSSTSSLTTPTTISIGSVNTNSNFLNGYVGEVLAYGSVVSKDNLQTLQRNEAWYYNMSAPSYVAYQYPLDTVTSAAMAVGLRKLRSAYAGSAIKVRRSSDNTTQDIGFDRQNNLDVNALMTFVGSGSGSIDTWYDQSGNGKDLTQATASYQPPIVNAGTLVMLNGKPTVYFDATNTTLTNATMSNTGTSASAAAFAAKSSTAGTTSRIMTVWKSGDSNDRQYNTSSAILATNSNYLDSERNSGTYGHVTANVPFTYDYPFVAMDVYDGTNQYLYMDGAQVATYAYSQAFGYTTVRLGCAWQCSTATDKFGGYISEAYLYNSSISTANRQWLTQNMESYYAAPLATAYVTKWYDQSGNGYNLAQVSPVLQPTLTLPNTGVNNNRPTVNFNGSQYMYSTTGFPTSSDYSISAVYSYFDATTSTNGIVGEDSNVHALLMSTTNALNLWHSGAFATTTAILTKNTNYAVAATFVNSSKAGTVYISNTSKGTGTAGVSNTSAGIQVGAFNNGGNTLYGTISEALIFNRVLSSTDRTGLYQSQVGYYGAQ